jgi:hypothetical protein
MMSNGRLEFAGKRSVMMDVAGGLYALKKTLRADIGFFEKDFMFKAGLEGTREFLTGLIDVGHPDDPIETVKRMLELYSLRQTQSKRGPSRRITPFRGNPFALIPQECYPASAGWPLERSRSKTPRYSQSKWTAWQRVRRSAGLS